MSVTAKINDALLKWSVTALAPWQHEAFRRILTNGGLTDIDKLQIFERAQHDLKLTVPASPLPSVSLTNADLPAGLPHKERVQLVALKALENVNALKPNQRIAFGKHLTVVYGENGSGKSGYVRVLKKTARCTEKAVESILENVFQATPVTKPAKAVFELDGGSGPFDVNWQDGQAAPDDLKRFAVFDSKCARQFLSSSNSLSLAPAIFDALRALGEITAEIKQKFLNLAKSSAPATPPPYQALIDQTSVGKALGAITTLTNPSTISALGQWTDQESETLAAKEIDLKKLQTLSPQAIRDQINREKRDASTIQMQVGQVATILSDASVSALKQLVAEVATHDQAFQAAVKLAFSDSKIEGVGTDAWKALIEAAAAFSTTEAYKEEPFPAAITESVCVLCQQPLSGDAAAKLKRFWTFLRDDAAKKRDTAKEKLTASLVGLKSLPHELPDEVRQLREEFEKNHLDLWQQTTQLFAEVPARVKAVEEAVAGEPWDTIPPFDGLALLTSQQLVSTLEEKLRAIQDDAQAQAEIKKQTREVAELNARKRLSENLSLVINHIAAIKASAKAQEAGDSIATNSISLKAKELHTMFITDAFKLSVQEQMKRIGVRGAKVAIEENSERGKVLHSIAVASTRKAVAPENVFSEGERTAISLSFFLADLGSVEDTCGVIFDDPVTSLDHRIRDGVVKALVAEAKNRQVIVFTHDLAFFCELISKARFEVVDAAPYYVESLSNTAGLVQGETPWDAMFVKDRMEKLQALISEAKAADSAGDAEGYKQKGARFYGRLRATWERTVEELIFNQVVCRSARAVQTMRLRGVAVEKDALTTIFDAMTRCSEVIDAHDHAVSATVPTPKLEEMEADLTKLRELVKAQKERIKAAEKANDHLKG